MKRHVDEFPVAVREVFPKTNHGKKQTLQVPHNSRRISNASILSIARRERAYFSADIEIQYVIWGRGVFQTNSSPIAAWARLNENTIIFLILMHLFRMFFFP